jgi:hypothetical protein
MTSLYQYENNQEEASYFKTTRLETALCLAAVKPHEAPAIRDWLTGFFAGIFSRAQRHTQQQPPSWGLRPQTPPKGTALGTDATAPPPLPACGSGRGCG